jgi:hypothetical protein
MRSIAFQEVAQQARRCGFDHGRCCAIPVRVLSNVENSRNMSVCNISSLKGLLDFHPKGFVVGLLPLQPSWLAHGSRSGLLFGASSRDERDVFLSPAHGRSSEKGSAISDVDASIL